MGVKQIWTNLFLRMRVFAPYYRRHLAKPYDELNPRWTVEQILQAEGVFLFTKVLHAARLPVPTIRARIANLEEPETEAGVYRDPRHGFLADMTCFGPWLRHYYGHLLVGEKVCPIVETRSLP